jgi:hypothetical protein
VKGNPRPKGTRAAEGGDPSFARAVEKGRSEAREHWEVIAALVIMMAVLAILELWQIRRPELLWTMAPLVFLLFSAIRPLTMKSIIIAAAATAIPAAVNRSCVHLGLVIPVLVMGVLLGAHRYRSARR